jgi:hypothetical protein
LLPIPLGPTRVLLDFARRILGENLPITAGQLEPFVADGVATSNFVAKRLRPEMVSLDALLARIAHAR